MLNVDTSILQVFLVIYFFKQVKIRAQIYTVNRTTLTKPIIVFCHGQLNFSPFTFNVA